jgi:phospholipid N-methyltransferase
VEPQELKTFSAEALANFQTTSAVAPSSRYLIRAMLAPLPLARARAVVEFGPGTGAITRALLDALPRQATLYSFEISPRFRDYLRQNLSDPRLVVIPAGAERVGEELAARGVRQLDAAVSSLGLTFMPDRQRCAALGGLVKFLAPHGVFTQYQYLHGLLAYWQLSEGRIRRFTAARLLRQYFSTAARELVWRNLPPALVFACRR